MVVVFECYSRFHFRTFAVTSSVFRMDLKFKEYDDIPFNNENLTFNFFITFEKDVDECAEGTHNCSGTCVNAVGTFRCVDREPVSCGLGFRYDAEKRECQGKQRILQLLSYLN